MHTLPIANQMPWENLGDEIVADDAEGPFVEASTQKLRERMERVFGWLINAEILMRLPHAFLGGETPWEVLYHTPGGARRIENILDLVEQDRLRVLSVRSKAKTSSRYAI